jgi:hypothetical protein
MHISDERILRILDLAAARLDREDDPVASLAVFNALRRANEAVKAAETRARAAEERSQELVSRRVDLLAAVDARVEAADARVRTVEEQITEERTIGAALREELARERRTVEALESHAADMIQAAEIRARQAEERLEQIRSILRKVLTAEEATRDEKGSPPGLLHWRQ